MTDIIYPTLDLFLYDVRNSLYDNPETIENNYKYFQGRIATKGSENIFKTDKGFEVEYYELLKEKVSRFESKHDSYDLKGYYYPVRIWDTYREHPVLAEILK